MAAATDSHGNDVLWKPRGTWGKVLGAILAVVGLIIFIEGVGIGRSDPSMAFTLIVVGGTAEILGYIVLWATRLPR